MNIPNNLLKAQKLQSMCAGHRRYFSACFAGYKSPDGPPGSDPTNGLPLLPSQQHGLDDAPTHSLTRTSK